MVDLTNGLPDYVVLIPTYSRPTYLRILLGSLANQSHRPLSIVVCDSSPQVQWLDVVSICDRIEFDIRLIRSDRPSSAGQRNELIESFLLMFPFAQFALFLDDDTIPHEKYAEIIITGLLQKGLTAGGGSGVTQETHVAQKSNLLARFFLLTGRAGSVLTSGVNTPPNAQSTMAMKSDWLFGCSMWRREVLRDFRFPSNWEGYALAEDVHFSYRVVELWDLWVFPAAHLTNSFATENRPNPYELARMELRHRWQICKFHRRSKFIVLFSYWWSTIGLLIFHTYSALRAPKDEHTLRLKGSVRAILDILTLKKRSD